MKRDSLQSKFEYLTDPGNPRFAKYLRPLSNAAAEAEAAEWANTTYNLTVEGWPYDPTFNEDAAYQRCLVDARRMLCDLEDYETIDDAQNFAGYRVTTLQ
jgi:hypothetical protein